MPDPESRSEDVAGMSPAAEPGMPRWVKVLGVIAAIVIVLVIVLLLIGGHGPGRHTGLGQDLVVLGVV